MVRSAERRIKKYETNVDGAAVGRAVKALKEIMVDQQRSYFPQITLLEMKVKTVVEAAGIPVHQVAQYINVARKCYHIAKTFSQATRDNEAQRIVDLWTSRGLNGLLVAEVCGLTGCKPIGAAPAAPAGLPIDYEVQSGTYVPTSGIAYYIIPLSIGRLFTPAYDQPLDRLYATLFHVAREMRLDELGLLVMGQGAAGAQIRVGIYSNILTFYPQTLIVDTGPLDATSRGIKTAAIDVTLDAGYYWHVFTKNQVAIDVAKASYPIGLMGRVEENPVSIANMFRHSYYNAYAYGPLPATFPITGIRDFDAYLCWIHVVALL